MAKLSYREVWGGQQFDREVYFKRGLLARMGKAVIVEYNNNNNNNFY